jgi:hypothetical protein
MLEPEVETGPPILHLRSGQIKHFARNCAYIMRLNDMKKLNILIILSIWLMLFPVVFLVIGFGGESFWKITTILPELSESYIAGVLIRLAIMLYFIVPLVLLFFILLRKKG